MPERRKPFGLVGALPSGSFAFVMATGIVSIAGAQLGFGMIARVLLAINLAAFIVLWVLTLLRWAGCTSAVLAEFCDHRRAPGFLTIVAGTNVLGDQIAFLTTRQGVAAGLWLCGSVLWLVLVYGFFAVTTTRARKPSLEAGLDGLWLLVTVATQSVAILGAQIAGVFPSPAAVVFISLALWLLGSALYAVIITLIFYRWLFAPMPPGELTPSYWINMGAAAITTLAGARLAGAVPHYPVLLELRGYVIAETMLFWSIASWWVPLLVGLTAWRHLVGGRHLSKPFEYWAMVFPLGMYATATFSFLPLVGAEFLGFLPHLFFWLALAAWCATALGTIGRLAGRAAH